MIVKVYMQDWFYNAGIAGFVNILKNAENNFVNIKDNYIEFDTENLRNFHEYYFKYFFDKYNIAEKMEKRITMSFEKIKQNIELDTDDKDRIKKAKENIKNEKKYIKEKIKKELDKIKKIDDQIWQKLNEKFVELDSINEKEDLKKLDSIQQELIKGFYEDGINKKTTSNLFKNNLASNYYGQNSFLNVIFNSLSYEEQMQKMYKDYVQNIVECGFLNDILEDKYSTEDIKKYIEKNIDSMNGDLSKIYERIEKKYLSKGLEEVKKYISDSVLETCSMCGETRLKTVDYSEGSFIPLAVSSENMRNSFWNQNYKFPICNLCNLILFCIPAGITSVRKTFKENGEYKEKDVLCFVNYDTTVDSLIRINNNFSNKSKRENAENNPYTAIIMDIIEQDKKISDWQLQNIFVVEFDSEYRGFSRMEYFNIKKYIAKFFIKYSEKTLNSIRDYRYKLQIVDNILKDKDISLIINNRLLDALKNNQNSKGVYDSFLAIKVRLYLNILKKEDFSVDEVIEKNNKKLYALYKMGIDIHEELKQKNEDNKLNGFTYKMLNSIKSGNKKEFMDSVIRIHMFMQKDVSPIFLEVMQDNDLDFESIGHSFVSGLISNKFDKNKEEE